MACQGDSDSSNLRQGSFRIGNVARAFRRPRRGPPGIPDDPEPVSRLMAGSGPTVSPRRSSMNLGHVTKQDVVAPNFAACGSPAYHLGLSELVTKILPRYSCRLRSFQEIHVPTAG